jgi:hypothetical protein
VRAHVTALLVALVTASFASAPAAAQTTVDTAVDTTLVTVGDRIELTVSVRHPTGSTVSWPDSLTLAPFEVLAARASEPRREGGIVVSTATFSLAAFELGELEIPAFDVTVTDASGQTEVLRTDRFAVEIVSVGTDEGGDIREIRGPLAVPVNPLWLLVAVLLVVVPALLAWLLYRRRAADGDPAAVRGPPPRMAHEIALEELTALEGSGLLERGRVKEYHIEASEILRTYVSRRFRIDALEMTTFELLGVLDRTGVDGSFRDGLESFLDQCDLVKFAKSRPDVGRSHRLLELARRLIEETIPAVPVPDVDIVVESAVEATADGPEGDSAPAARVGSAADQGGR